MPQNQWSVTFRFPGRNGVLFHDHPCIGWEFAEEGIDFLIGMDVLLGFRFVLNGPQGTIALTWR